MKRFLKWYSETNIYISLMPLLFAYLIICYVFIPDELVGDEGRYLKFANNLLNGSYSPGYPNNEANLWSGPGYPLFIALFLYVNLPLIVIRLINSLLIYLSLVISYKTMNVYSSHGSSLIFAYILGLYMPIFRYLSLILTECFAWFLISLVCFTLVKSCNNKNMSWNSILVAAFSIACLAMTKVIFGHVIIVMLIISSLIYFLPKYRSTARKATLIFASSLILCLPWLLYTYSLTNKYFYWADSGGMSLYTMSSPFDNELGDWHNAKELQLNLNHKKFMDRISQMNTIEKVEAYKNAAMSNIKNHPKKYLSNWIANVGRLILSYPSSHQEQTLKSYKIFIPNMFVIVFIILTLSVSIIRYKKIPEVFILLLLFFLVYLFGSTLVSAYVRMFSVTMPFWFLFFSYFFNNIVSVKIINN